MELCSRILVVEDEPTLARDLKRKLQHLGYEVCGPTGSGEHALVLADTQRPDLVLMDIQLEGPMDGIAAADHLRRTLDLPVVFLTAYSDDRILRAASAVVPAGYLVKPCTERELKVVIELALYRRALEDQARLDATTPPAPAPLRPGRPA